MFKSKKKKDETVVTVCEICETVGNNTYKHSTGISTHEVLHVCKECHKKLKYLEEVKPISRNAIRDLEDGLIKRANNEKVKAIIHAVAEKCIEEYKANFQERIKKGQIEEYHLKKCPKCEKWVFEHTEYCFHCISKCEFLFYSFANPPEFERETVYLTASDYNVEKKAYDSEISYTNFTPLVVLMVPVGMVLSITQGGWIVIILMIAFAIYGLLTQSEIRDYYSAKNEDVDNSKRAMIQGMIHSEKCNAEACERKKQTDVYYEMQKRADEMREKQMRDEHIAFWKSLMGGKTTSELAEEERRRKENER